MYYTNLIGPKVQKAYENAPALLNDHLELPQRPLQTIQIKNWAIFDENKKKSFGLPIQISRGLAERRFNSDYPASRQKFVVSPAFLETYLFMYWEVWIMMIYWLYISRRHVLAWEPWSLLYWWTTRSGRYYVVPDLNVKTETMLPLKENYCCSYFRIFAIEGKIIT